MGTVTSLMDLARQSLMADQAAIGVVSNNVANQNTPGYTRQVVDWQSRDSVTIGNYTVGGGVDVSSGISQRDRVLEVRVQQQTQAQAQSQSLETALNQLENIFGISSTSTSATSTTLGSAMDSFFNALSSLTANPSDTVVRQQVLSAAKNMADAFSSSSTQLTQLSSDLDTQAAGYVNQINMLTKTIATLNQKISASSPNADAGQLEDQRQQAIAQLSQYIGLDQIRTEGNGITLTTAGSAVLVSGSQSYDVSKTLVGGITHVIAGPSGTDITSTISGGALAGVLIARDQQVAPTQNALDNLAYAIGAQVNYVNALGVDGYASPGSAIFTVPGTSPGAAGMIQLATTDPKKLASAGVGEGQTGNINAQKLADLATMGIVSGQTTSDFFASVLAEIGSAAQDATTNNTTQQAILTQLTSQRDSLSRVSLDEEASNLTAYQRSYEAAAKVFSVADQLMASAINLGIDTSVS